MIEDIFEGIEAAQGDFRSVVVALAGASQEPEPEVGDVHTGNAPWQELCDLLQVEDEDILQAGKAEDERLLRLRADPSEESIKRVEEMIKENKKTITQKDKTIAQLAGGVDTMALINGKDKTIAELEERLKQFEQTQAQRKVASWNGKSGSGGGCGIRPPAAGCSDCATRALLPCSIMRTTSHAHARTRWQRANARANSRKRTRSAGAG
jgi:TolA-binding protein